MDQAIRVILKLRPILENEEEEEPLVYEADENAITILPTTTASRERNFRKSNAINKNCFKFDSIHDPASDEGDFYSGSAVQNLISESLENPSGYLMNNVTTIMAYGQSGAGKTYTINNVVKSVVEDLYDNYGTEEIYCSYFQIYNERIKELIIQSSDKNSEAYRKSGYSHSERNSNYQFLAEDLKLKLKTDNTYGIEGLASVK